MRAVAIVLSLLLLLVATAARAAGPAGEPGGEVVLLLDDAPREGLVDALRIHVPRGTRVVVGPRPRASTAAGRIREAHGALSGQEGGVLAMWLDEDRPAVLARPEGAPARPAGAGARPPVALAMALELDAYGATAAATVGPQLGGQVAAGLALQGDGWLADVVATARIPTPLSTESDAGSLEVSEVAFGGAARALWTTRLSSVALGGFVHGGARVLSGDGTTPWARRAAPTGSCPLCRSGRRSA